jgi:hypothetical protein
MKDKIIDEFIDEVTKDMNARQRADVSKELKSHILDSADALAAERKTDVGEDIVREVIEKMGSPKKIAAMYTPATAMMKEMTVGKIVKVIMSLMLAFVVVMAVLLVVSPDLGIPNWTILMTASGLLTAFGVVAAILFAIYLFETIYRSGSIEARLERLDKSLNDVSSPLRAIFGSVANMIVLIILNLYWKKIPFIKGLGDAQIVPLFSDNFGNFLPYINILGLAMIMTYMLYLAVPRKWIPAAIETIIMAGNCILAAYMLLEFPFNTALSTSVTLGIKVLLVLAVIGTLVGIAKQLWQTMVFLLGQK